MKFKINPKLIPLAYQLSKEIYDKAISHAEAVEILSKDGQMNAGSAKHYFDNFKLMLAGRKFSMTFNTASMEYFLLNIHKDYHNEGLTQALLSLYKHINYYEEIQNTNMKSMWKLFNTYKQLIPLPLPVKNLSDITSNIDVLENYLVSEDPDKRLSAQNLIKQGTCFLAYKVNGEFRFAPSRYLGYIDNRPYKYLIDIDGTETNKIISDILGSRPHQNEHIDTMYTNYCKQLGFSASEKGRFGVIRKYWELEIVKDNTDEDELYGGFPEGKMIERLHKSRERNAKVIALAKKNFKKLHGKLYCEICTFDFKEIYGELGEDFIEGHHTIWVSDMPNDYKTRPEEIAMLCSNCHRMIHRRRPWLTMTELKVITPDKM